LDYLRLPLEGDTFENIATVHINNSINYRDFAAQNPLRRQTSQPVEKMRNLEFFQGMRFFTVSEGKVFFYHTHYDKGRIAQLAISDFSGTLSTKEGLPFGAVIGNLDDGVVAVGPISKGLLWHVRLRPPPAVK
jgi:hypothetical protein